MSTYVVLLTKRAFYWHFVGALKINLDALEYLNIVLKYVHVFIFNHFWSKW